MTKIFIATPTYDETVTVPYLISMLETYRVLQQERKVEIESAYFGGAMLTHSRNAMASAVLQDASFSHLLFVDSDIGFRAATVLKLLDCDKPFVGCIYPSRTLNREQVIKAARQTAPDATVPKSATQDFVAADFLIPEPGGGYRVRDGFVRAHALGCGLTLIKREVLERIAARYPKLLVRADDRYRAKGVKETVLQCFDQAADQNGLTMSEDISFCLRWTQGCGGEIWACVDQEISHTGRYVGEGRYIERLAFDSRR